MRAILLNPLMNFWKNIRGSAVSATDHALMAAHQHPLKPSMMSANAVKVVQRLQQKGYEAFIVGGCLRDLLLGEVPKDFDVSTSAHPDQVKELFTNCRLIGRRFRLAHVYFGREVIEVATFRGHHTADGIKGKRARHISEQDEQGRLLSDNVYGSLAEDAVRRDFTVNTFYYDPVRNELRCYASGLEDLHQRILRLLGDPETRYREDPVRMLRAIRFMAKLDFQLEAQTEAPIQSLGHLLREIPGARLFDEVLKLFHSGKGVATFVLIQRYGLLPHLFPDTYPLVTDHGATRSQRWLKLMELAIHNTDQRIGQGKTVTPAFLFAVILWPVFLQHRQALLARDEVPHIATHRAASLTLDQQLTATVIPRRFSSAVREIWELQFRLPSRLGKRADILLSHQRFRAAYDFLLLREKTEEIQPGLGEWWTHYQSADENTRRQMTRALSKDAPRVKQRRKH